MFNKYYGMQCHLIFEEKGLEKSKHTPTQTQFGSTTQTNTFLCMNHRMRIRSGILNTRMYYYWRRKWQPTPIFLPGKSHRREPKGLQFMGSQRVRHDWATKQRLIIVFPTVDFRPFLENYFLKFNSDFKTSMQLEWLVSSRLFHVGLFLIWEPLIDCLALLARCSVFKNDLVQEN